MPQLEDNVTSEYSFRTVQPETSTEGGQAPSTTFDRELPDLIQLGRTINMYGSVIVLVIGVVGNLLTLVVMRRSSFKKSTSSIFFSNLAIADLFHLFDYLTGRWFAAHKGWDVWEAWGDFACKMKRVSYLFGINWPAWIVVAMTFERVLVVLFPLKAKVWLTRRNAHVTCACIAIFFFVLWTVLILMWGVSSGRCRLKEVLTFLQDYGYPLATTLYTYVPTPLLILMNGVLIHQLVKVRLTQKKMTNSTVREQAMDKGLTRVTIMAILVSVTYLFLTLPSMIIAYLDSMIDMSQYDPVVMKFLREVFFVVRDLNHAVNFYLYLLVLPRVKTELAELVGCFCIWKHSQSNLQNEAAPSDEPVQRMAVDGSSAP